MKKLNPFKNHNFFHCFTNYFKYFSEFWNFAINWENILVGWCTNNLWVLRRVEKKQKGFLRVIRQERRKVKKASTRGWHIFYVTLLFRYRVRSQSKPNLRSISRANTDDNDVAAFFCPQVPPRPHLFTCNVSREGISFSLYLSPSSNCLCISPMSVCAASGKPFPSTW